MDSPVIELDGISVKKANALLLDTVCLQVLRNEFIGIIGPNGAGKTTLLNVVAGFEKFSGNLRLFGHTETWMRTRETRMHIGYVTQSFEIDSAFPILAMEAVLTGVYGASACPKRRASPTCSRNGIMDRMRSRILPPSLGSFQAARGRRYHWRAPSFSARNSVAG
jgi:ABC-type Mn2+/Zn2+ transport system ATPase subunit